MQQFNVGLPNMDWDEHQGRKGGHILQGRPWAIFQQALGRPVYWAESVSWSWMGYVVQTRGIKYLYVPYGPTLMSDHDLEEVIINLKNCARELNLDFVRCEPLGI